MSFVGILESQKAKLLLMVSQQIVYLGHGKARGTQQHTKRGVGLAFSL